MNEPRHDVTQLLIALSDGERAALDDLMPIVYEELRLIAHRNLQKERRGHTLNTTALVHEAFLNLVNLDRIQWKNRAQFFAISARVMRWVLIDYANRRKAQKRGGGRAQVTLEDHMVADGDDLESIVALDDALTRLEAFAERCARVVECRFFAGMTIEETAEALDISPATVKRDWATARAWLNRELAGDDPEAG